MSNDLELIKQLKEEIGVKLKETKKDKTVNIAYQRDYKDRVFRLELEDLKLTEFPKTIFKFNNLEYLSLNKNEISSLPPEIKQLTNLKTLKLGNNPFGKFPQEITQLINLIELYLTNNQLNILPPEISQLTNLTTLNISKNQLSTLPPEIIQLINLKELYLVSNQLNIFPPEILQLTSLTKLDLSGNQISTLPPEISQLTNLTELDLEDNLLKLPPEIATGKDNIERILNYFAELESQGEDYIYEAKLILVGEPGAGKTSLCKKLQDPKYKLSATEPMTKGIEVNKWHFPFSKKIPFQCNIWDFGGQDIMHATHRYFLTKRSLYVLMADNRKEDTDFYYWLNILELLSGKSPVLIVLNEKHKYKKSVPESILKSFKSVQKVFPVNLADNTGLADLSKAIQTFIKDLPHVGKDPIPKNWVSIRGDLEAEKQNYITHDQYMEICKNYGIEDEKQADYISEFLHDLGVILHFQKDRLLRSILILNTRWATEAVYQVLFDHTVIENGGEFDNRDLERIWKQRHYKDKHAELLQLMLNFELCYEIGNSQKYIIPDLLPEKPPANKKLENDFKEKDLLHFEYRYDFMPKGILSRLTVRMNKYIYKKQQWKNGMVVKNGDSLAEIVEYFNAKKLEIRIFGNDRLETLAIIRNEVKNLHDTFETLVVHEMVPCNCEECKKNEAPYFFSYDELKQYKQEGEQNIKCRVGKIKDVNVLSLISDVIIDADNEMKGKRERDQIIEFKPVIDINVEGAKADVKVTTDVEVNVDIDIDIKVDLPAIQNEFAALKNEIAGANPELKEELNRIEDSLDEVSPKSDEKELAKPMNKMRRFLDKVEDKNSDFHKAIKGAKKGIEMAQKVGKTYNKFAQWLALPQVPDLFLDH